MEAWPLLSTSRRARVSSAPAAEPLQPSLGIRGYSRCPWPVAEPLQWRSRAATEIPASGLRRTGTGRPVLCGKVAHDNRGVVTGLSGGMLVYDKVVAVALDEGAPHGRWLGVTLPRRCR